jgi:hypothetical protein
MKYLFLFSHYFQLLITNLRCNMQEIYKVTVTLVPDNSRGDWDTFTRTYEFVVSPETFRHGVKGMLVVERVGPNGNDIVVSEPVGCGNLTCGVAA